MSAPVIAYPVGVWPDGTLPGYPPSRPALRAYAATDAAIQLTVRAGSGLLLDLTGYTVRLCTDWNPAGYVATVAAPATGVALFTLAETDLDVPSGRYDCQFEATDGNGLREMLTRVGTFTVLAPLG